MGGTFSGKFGGEDREHVCMTAESVRVEEVSGVAAGCHGHRSEVVDAFCNTYSGYWRGERSRWTFEKCCRRPCELDISCSSGAATGWKGVSRPTRKAFGHGKGAVEAKVAGRRRVERLPHLRAHEHMYVDMDGFIVLETSRSVATT